LYGGGLRCINCNALFIDGSRFENLNSELGGAIYLKEEESNKLTATT
jgi:hypothetical protein